MTLPRRLIILVTTLALLGLAVVVFRWQSSPAARPVLSLGEEIWRPELKPFLDRRFELIQDRDTISAKVPNGFILRDHGNDLNIPSVRRIFLTLDGGFIQKIDLEHSKRPLARGELSATVSSYAALFGGEGAPEFQILLNALAAEPVFPVAADLKWCGVGITIVAHQDRAQEPDTPPPSTYYVTVTMRDDALIPVLFARSQAARAAIGKPDGPVMLREYPAFVSPK